MADAASPQPHAQVVAAATGGDQQALDVGVTPAAHQFPPTADRHSRLQRASSRARRSTHQGPAGSPPPCPCAIATSRLSIAYRSLSGCSTARRGFKTSLRCRDSHLFSMELVQQLLEGLFSCPIGCRHGVKIDRRLLYRAPPSGTINLPPPRLRRGRPVLHDD
jgi:hypothetical protein